MPSAERLRIFFIYILFLSIPFSIAGGDFAIIGCYLCTIYLFLNRREKWISTPIQWGMILMLLGAFISALASSDTLAGLSYFRSFWRFGLPFVVFFALKDRPVMPFIRVVLIVSCLIAAYSVAQFFTGLDILRSPGLQEEYFPNGRMWHAVGAFSHHLTYGGVSLILFSLFAPSVFNSALSMQQRMLFALGALCNLAALFLSLGRSIWLGAMAAIGVMILLKIRVRVIVILLVLAGLFTASYLAIDTKTKQRFYNETTIGRRIDSINIRQNIDRILMWTAAVNMIKDHPLLGLGPNNAKEMQPYYDRLAKQEKHRFNHPAKVGVHNIYLQNWIDFGLLGLVGYMAWWVFLLVAMLRSLHTARLQNREIDSFLIGLFAGFTGMMIAGFFENNFRDGEVQTTIFTAMGLALALMHQKAVRSTTASSTA